MITTVDLLVKRGEEEGRLTLPAAAKGPFAIHRGDIFALWTLTHIPTGLMVCRSWGLQGVTRARAALLALPVAWEDMTIGETVPHDDYILIYQTLRRHVRSGDILDDDWQLPYFVMTITTNRPPVAVTQL